MIEISLGITQEKIKRCHDVGSVTNKLFKKVEHRGQKKPNKLELNTFSRIILFQVFYYILGHWKKLIFYSESKQILKHI